VIGYLTVPSHPHGGQSSTSPDLITAACERAGWKLTELVRDRESGRILDRPGLRYALERIASRDANTLVIGELERLSRSIVDLGALMAWFRDSDAALVALDDVDFASWSDESLKDHLDEVSVVLCRVDAQLSRLADAVRSRGFAIAEPDLPLAS
jgi:hypothetical protein